jgi:hypothetical protein
MIGTTAEVLFAAAVGIPLVNPIVKRRYPSGSSRFLQVGQELKPSKSQQKEQEGSTHSNKVET